MPSFIDNLEDGGGAFSTPAAKPRGRGGHLMTPSRRKMASADIIVIGSRERL
jgi:hypothetical protein